MTFNFGQCLSLTPGEGPSSGHVVGFLPGLLNLELTEQGSSSAKLLGGCKLSMRTPGFDNLYFADHRLLRQCNDVRSVLCFLETHPCLTRISRFHSGVPEDYDAWAAIMDGEDGAEKWRYENFKK
jgi:hypothetical protein